MINIRIPGTGISIATISYLNKILTGITNANTMAEDSVNPDLYT